jgi:cellulose synthase/poly-beta-1,6-N-acetylglucosamine synthase-like glycosyltransferase
MELVHPALLPPDAPVPLVLPVSADQARRHLITALTGLDAAPEFSARRTPTTPARRRRRVVVAAGWVLVTSLALVWRPLLFGQLLCAVAAFVYLSAVGYRILCVRRAARGDDLVTGSDQEALAATVLPRYTVLVPAYREPEIIGELVAHVKALDYPPDRLEVLVLLERRDHETLAALAAATPPAYIRAVIVPPSELTTKPKACNYGLALATGRLLTIYDAEDRPEPLQLRRAAVAFTQLPETVACLQARLAFWNAHQNLLTAWFTAEYVTWFRHFLPGLASLGSPIPLGGTSNHIRVSVLREVGGWDPYNVTEDADLGLRLARRGYGVEVLDSTTQEEANSDVVNWAKQRSRWYKGYLQTWLVHMRHPVRLRREIGWRGMLGFNLFVGGTPLLALLNPLFWALALLYFLGGVHGIARLFPDPVYFPAMIAWVLGNIAMVYLAIFSLREARREDLVWATLLVPLYWVLMAVAAIKAAVQLIRQPSLWEKTTHGLARRPAPAGPGLSAEKTTHVVPAVPVAQA